MNNVNRQTLTLGLSIVAVATTWQAAGTAAIGALSTPAVSAVLSFIAFASAALFCSTQAAVSGRGTHLRELLRDRVSGGFVLLQNAMTAGVFVCFYFSLAFVPATAASVIEAGIGPLVAASAMVRFSTPDAARRFLFPTLTAVIAAIIVVLSLASSSHAAHTQGVGVLLAVCAGLCGVGVVLCSMKLVGCGFTATDINATRFHGAWLVSGIAVLLSGLPNDAASMPVLFIVGIALGAAPLVVLQYGITRSTPLPTELVMSSLPALVFLSESLIRRSFEVDIALWMGALLACSVLAVLTEQRHTDPPSPTTSAELAH